MSKKDFIKQLQRLYAASAFGSIEFIVKDTETTIISDRGREVLQDDDAMAKVYKQIDEARNKAAKGVGTGPSQFVVDLSD